MAVPGDDPVTLPRGPRLVGSTAVTALVDAVEAYRAGGQPRSAVIMGGFGAGKSYALRRAADVAASAGLRVALLDRGPVGISSYGDFLVAVAKAIHPAEFAHSDVDAWRTEVAREGDPVTVEDLERRVLSHPTRPRLVIVVESLDQLLHQVRASDRPLLVSLLTRQDPGCLILGSVHGSALVSELGAHVDFVPAQYLESIDAGIALALEEARQLDPGDVKAGSRLVHHASDFDPTITSNWLFWSLVGRYLVIARRDPLRWAEAELRARSAGHFGAMLLGLAPSEQRVLLTLAEAGRPQSVGELADRIGVRNQASATALGRLLADDWVTIVDMPEERDRRRTWYAIADPMLRMHLLPAGDAIRDEVPVEP